MKRRQDWAERLADFIESDHCFDWETNNCAFFAADAIKAMTDVDLAKDFRSINSKLALLKKLERLGGIENVISDCLGEPLPTLKLAGRGDIVLLPTEFGVSVGVCIGKIVAAISEKGLLFYDKSLGLKAWKV